jgi:hypothetical protein
MRSGPNTHFEPRGVLNPYSEPLELYDASSRSRDISMKMRMVLGRLLVRKSRRSRLSNSFRASFRSLGRSARCLSSFRPFSFELAGVRMPAQKQARSLESQDGPLNGGAIR